MIDKVEQMNFDYKFDITGTKADRCEEEENEAKFIDYDDSDFEIKLLEKQGYDTDY